MAQTDIYLVIGVVLCILSIPAFFSALIDGRLPFVTLIVAVIGGGLIFWAHMEIPGGLTLTSVPEAFVHLAAWMIR